MPGLKLRHLLQLERSAGTIFDTRYYDRDGLVINQWTFAHLLGDRDYRIVEQTELDQHWVSTVWLGIDHGFGFAGRAPLIFETMIFSDDDLNQKLWRYSTEEDARAGHREVVKRLKEWSPPKH